MYYAALIARYPFPAFRVSKKIVLRNAWNYARIGKI
jgi:hypothetical protein